MKYFRAIILFLSIVWRKGHGGRISWPTAWQTSKDIWFPKIDKRYLQRQFEKTGYTSWINSDIYPDGKIYTKAYTEWLEKQIIDNFKPHYYANK